MPDARRSLPESIALLSSAAKKQISGAEEGR
jgi:hypothetical protein